MRGRSSFLKYWDFGEVIFLNHGSFGACPKPVRDRQNELKELMEKEPVEFLARNMQGLLEEARKALANFIGAQSEDLVFVPNATHGVNTVLRSIPFKEGDEIICTNHIYFACTNALNFISSLSGVRIVNVLIPYPPRSREDLIDPILSSISPRTRLVLIDHITSPTALIFPIEEIVRELEGKGIPVLVDGAHGPGMVPLNMNALQASFYAGNCHKWLCTPKGSAFLWVRKDWQKKIRPLAISHLGGDYGPCENPFQVEFSWSGTMDLTPYLTIPYALRFLGSLYPGGIEELMRRNHELTLYGKKVLAEALNRDFLLPEEFIGSMVSFPIPPREAPWPLSKGFWDPDQERLFKEFKIEVPVIYWPQPPRRLIRISAQAYNEKWHYELLKEALRKIFPTSG
ncbi:MAG: aminotransferase class V-fold PLP-dependent enzyme [Coprothermobacterota bacterium]|nr:aminotransferase class V-fold PLP-dependent enzyme [Coprothermobacterota bacterium]